MRKLLLILFALLAGFIVTAQNGLNKDSLLHLLTAAKEDTAKVKLLNNLAKATKNSDIAASYKYTADALALSEKISYNKGRFLALINEISLIRIEGKDSLALEKCKTFVQLAGSLKDSFYIAAGYLNLGEVYDNNGDNERSVQFCFKGLQIAERLNEKSLLQDAYSALQRIYLARSEFDKAIQYGKLAVTLAREMNNKAKEATQSYNLAYTYNLTKDFDKSIAVSENVLKVSREIGEKRIESYALYNLCSINLRTGKLNEALRYGLMCLEIARQNSDKGIESSTLAALASIYAQLRQYKEAEKYATEALYIREKTEDKLGIIEIKSILANIYFALDQPAKAYSLRMEVEDFEDSYNQSILSKQSSELEKKYETEKKEARIKIQQAQIHQKNILNYFLIGGAAALLVILLLTYHNYRNRQKLQQAKIDELETEKQLTATEAVLKGEEQERTRLAKDLHDGLGGMLSGIKFSLSNMKENLIMTPENAQAFERSIDMLDSSIKEMRRVAHNMMPEVLVKYGLDKALKEFCSEIDRSGAISVSYQSVGMNNAGIEQTTAVTIYRIVQELVNNAIKHAQAKNLLVQLHQAEKERLLAITVEDDGKGFDVASLKQSGGMGWHNIENRVEFLNGKLDIQSGVDKGTSVMIEFTI
ncbi:tetratricopeptide repeat-containing sensor histidine kinase [Parafilimonas sp.]|uniref:tetratricopeptide repeat-containing sensor histidine kinase n=1 Tax=Parafilimonas sp. TaxID=1969739 RepID=UPI003F7EFE31